jgi:hypothetical protein
VTAQAGDNAHRIFESLNNTGLRLTQGDLLRNYLFMRLPTRGEAVYHALWLPLQGMLSSSELEQLFWLDLVQRDPRIKQTDTYTAQQARLDRLASEEAIESEITRFARLAGFLKTLLNPAREPDPLVRLRLERLSAWGTTTVYPLLLHLLDRRDQGTASSEEIARAMLYVESFFVRRLIIGRATANINRILVVGRHRDKPGQASRRRSPQLPVSRPQVLRQRHGDPHRRLGHPLLPQRPPRAKIAGAALAG